MIIFIVCEKKLSSTWTLYISYGEYWMAFVMQHGIKCETMSNGCNLLNYNKSGSH